MSRSIFVRAVLGIVTVTSVFSMIGCTGARSYLAGRTVPPSAILERVLVAIQNPSPSSAGALQIVDARYDIRNSENGTVPYFFVGGYSGKVPSLILNYPEQAVGYVYGAGDGSVTPIDYAKEIASAPVIGLTGQSSSLFVPSSALYVIRSQPDCTIPDDR